MWLEKAKPKTKPETIACLESVVISGLDVIDKSISGPFFAVAGMASGVKQLWASREGTLEFPALLLCRFKLLSLNNGWS